MTHYVKKPIVVQAIQWNGDNFDDVALLGDYIFGPYGQEDAHLEIQTLEGRMKCNQGDWVIRGVKGECYPCKDDIFRATYDKVDEI